MIKYFNKQGEELTETHADVIEAREIKNIRRQLLTQMTNLSDRLEAPCPHTVTLIDEPNGVKFCAICGNALNPLEERAALLGIRPRRPLVPIRQFDWRRIRTFMPDDLIGVAAPVVAPPDEEERDAPPDEEERDVP